MNIDKRKWSKPVEYNGIEFASSLEAKFALLIEDSCEYMYEPITIWYNPSNLNLQMKSECNHRYIPDFLVRKLKDNSAHLIEVKPHQEVTQEMVQLKKFLAERYIARKGYDWKYHIITDKEIILSKDKSEKYQELIKTRMYLSGKRKLRKLEKRFNSSYEYYKNHFPIRTNVDLDEQDYVIFLKKGFVRDTSISL